MKKLPSSAEQQNKEDAAATLDLPRLTMANVASIPSVPGLHRRTITAVGMTDGVLPGNETSRQASIRWRPNPQAPIYQPLNVPPLGMGSHHPLTDLATEAPVSKPLPCRRTVSKRAKQSVSHGCRATSSPRFDKSRRGSLTLPAHLPIPSRETGLQPPDRRLATPSSPPAPNSPAAPRPSPGDTVEGPAVPVPVASYLAQSAIANTKRPTPQPLLLVLDLNGTLLYRPKASSAYRPRASLESFLSHCISNYKVLIWSSATPQNVTRICSRIFTPEQRKLLLGEWARDTLDLTALQYTSKVQVYKRLDRIWNLDRIQRTHPDFQMGQRWGQWNTLLLDDSVLKSSAQPHNAVVVPEFTKKDVTEEAGETEVLGQVVAYLETARTFDNVSSFVRDNPFQVNDQWRWDWARARALWVEKGSESDKESGGVKI
ncbi:MAG: hypothetical protein L6R42_001406 [Xanthoria sp. 1 TBL-2021]|nr:MAG: hypothetical protein L6R42_001406 [Xanthoria sp. 1 TBL-2021]